MEDNKPKSQRNYCSRFYCERMQENLCCRFCDRYEFCIDRCENTPKKCGLYTKVRVNNLNNSIKGDSNGTQKE